VGSPSISNLNSDRGATGGRQGGASGWVASRIAYLRDSGLFSFDGRSGRGDYWMAVLWGHLVPMVVTLPILLPGILLGTLVESSAVVQFVGESLVILGAVACSGLYLWILSAALVKRFHDLNLTGWAALIYLPLIYSYPILLIVQGSLRGTNGPNRYGADPVGLVQMKIA